MSYHDLHFAVAAESGRAIVESLGGRWGPSGGMCRCPAHGDRTPSLSVRLGRKRLLFHCFAGCDSRAVLHALHALRLPGTASWSPAERHDPPDDLSRRAAQQLWSEARVAAGSPAERYLASRGIKSTPALRFHPRTPLGPKPSIDRSCLATADD
jgi:putative DNA primase/helicase